MRAVRKVITGPVSSVDAVIAEFERRFMELRLEFVMGAALQVNHTTLLVLDLARNIGKNIVTGSLMNAFYFIS